MHQAVRLYETGAAATMKEASAAVGFAPGYLAIANHNDPRVEQVRKEIRDKLTDNSINVAALIEAMGRRALSRINDLMEQDHNYHVALRAAIDLADRAPTTAKTQRHQVNTFSLDGKDALAIAEALVKAADVRQSYDAAAEGDFVRVVIPEGPSPAPDAK